MSIKHISDEMIMSSVSGLHKLGRPNQLIRVICKFLFIGGLSFKCIFLNQQLLPVGRLVKF